ncbi:hypothetical protein HPG69_005432 [Diceros bicornis minor]|uniref:Uncharacterized protein n=1 Tax=Diceros bicornis minor TaxID=77932 RepID=A0A7J7ELQ5_DICBM|nr:hypothetical protein HPG69_005432 [Diceros bicornis minor]
MSIQGLSLIFPLLFICFFKESFCICDGTIWTKLKKQASLDTLGNDLESQSFHDIDQILCRLMAKTSMMTTYLNQSSPYLPAKKVKHRKPKRKKTEGRVARRYPYAKVAQSHMKITQQTY